MTRLTIDTRAYMMIFLSCTIDFRPRSAYKFFSRTDQSTNKFAFLCK